MMGRLAGAMKKVQAYVLIQTEVGRTPRLAKEVGAGR
jgi:hypothetical protein